MEGEKTTAKNYNLLMKNCDNCWWKGDGRERGGEALNALEIKDKKTIKGCGQMRK
jgi:hypothetical protein